MPRLGVNGFVTGIVCVLAVAPPVFAQANASSRAAAESLFDEGVRLMKAGNFASACPTLEESQRVDPGVGTLLYLGECYEDVGRTASAWATFREAASLAGSSGQRDRERVASERSARLEPQLAYVKITVGAENVKLPGFSVTVGTAVLRPALLGIVTPVDPGQQVVTVSASGYESYSVTLAVEATKRYEVVVPELRAGAEPAAPVPPPATAVTPVAAPPPPPAPPPAAESHGSSPLKTVGIVVGAAGVVGLGVGTYFGIRAINKNHQATDGSCANGICGSQADLDLVHQAKDAAKVSNIAFAAGGVAVVGGALLYFLAPKTRESGLTLTPYATAKGGGLAVGGRL
jgi:hypothetical protein